MSNQVTPTQNAVYDRTAFIADLQKLQEHANTVVAEAEAMLITSDEEDIQATEVLKKIKLGVKGIEDDKEANWRPFKKAADEIAGAYKPLIDALDRAESNLKGKMVVYRSDKQKREAARLEAERREREDAAIAEAEKIMADAAANADKAKANTLARIAQLRAEGKDALADRLEAIVDQQIGKLVSDNQAAAEKVVDQAARAKVEKVETVTRSESGKSYMTSTWDFEITDPNAVPREYCSPNETFIRNSVRQGVREIPGIRIFEKQQISIR